MVFLRIVNITEIEQKFFESEINLSNPITLDWQSLSSYVNHNLTH